MSKDELCYTLSRFLCEIKKQNGEDYPGETLYELIICIQLSLELDFGREYKFLNDQAFSQLKNTLDSVMKERAASGISVKRRQADVISQQEEEMLWDKGILGTSSPQQLLDTLIYMFGINFALRAAQEHKNLRWNRSQIELLTDEDGRKFLRYTEDVSKANAGGLRHRRVKAKMVDAYENLEDPNRCIVEIYLKYIAHCPTEDRPDCLYLRPLPKAQSGIWYARQPLGINKLSAVVKRICALAGLSGHRTNHSLRATAASRLYESGVDEQLICETTGHRSNSVRSYKRTTADMKRHLSDIIQIGKSAPIANGVIAKSAASGQQANGNELNITVNVNL